MSALIRRLGPSRQANESHTAARQGVAGRSASNSAVTGYRFRMTPPLWFAVISLALIVVTAVISSVSQATFFRRAIVNHEATIVSEMVTASVRDQELVHELSTWDFENYTEAEAQARLDNTFSILKHIPGVVLVKLFGRNKTIIWSDRPSLVGKKLTRHPQDLARALDGKIGTVYETHETSFSEEVPKDLSLIEFYVPVNLESRNASRQGNVGVVALYRSTEKLDTTIWSGLLLLWAATWTGGLLLFVALYKLFLTVYHKQREAESQLATLNTEHERLIHLEKLSAMGQLVTEIAHQLNNPLVGVISLAELAEREADNPQRLKELLGEVRMAGGHCRDFVQKMLLLNKVARYQPQQTDMVALVRETISFFQQSLRNASAINLESPRGPVMLEVDPVLVRHALFNLIHNAADAAPKEPMTISLALERRGDVPGCWLSVSDSGPGIKPELMAKLFSPFFTTKRSGTGLGLSIARHIAALHGGSLQAENRPAGGACFTLWLPQQRKTRP